MRKIGHFASLQEGGKDCRGVGGGRIEVGWITWLAFKEERTVEGLVEEGKKWDGSFGPPLRR